MRIFSVLIIYLLLSSYSWCQEKFDTISIYNKVTDSLALDVIKLPQYTTESYDKKLDSLSKQYLEKGFLNLKIVKDFSVDHKDLRIILGEVFATISIHQNILNIPDRIDESSLSRKRNTFIAPQALTNHLSSIQAQWNEKGLPFAKVEVDRWDFTKKDTAELYLRIFPNQKRKIDKIVVKGYPNYPKNIVNQKLTKKTWYTEKNATKIQTQLSNLPYLKSLKPPEALFKKDSTSLYLYLEKINANKAEGLVAFNTNPDGSLQINGFIDASLINNFNYGESILVAYRSDDQDQTTLDLSVDVPGVILQKIGFQSGLNIIRRDSVYQNSNFTAGINYRTSWNSRLSLNYFHRSSTQLGSDTAVADLATRGANLGWQMETYSSSRLQPQSFFLHLNGGYYDRKTAEMSNSQYELQLKALKNWRLSGPLFLNTRINAYLLKTSNLQFNELVQVGGTRSIRGFPQNNIDTAAYFIAQTDVRYIFNEQIYVNLLNDAGVFEGFLDRNPQYLYAFGAGFGILTKAGLLQLQVANGRYLSSKPSISSTIAHLNFTILF